MDSAKQHQQARSCNGDASAPHKLGSPLHAQGMCHAFAYHDHAFACPSACHVENIPPDGPPPHVCGAVSYNHNTHDNGMSLHDKRTGFVVGAFQEDIGIASNGHADLCPETLMYDECAFHGHSCPMPLICDGVLNALNVDCDHYTKQSAMNDAFNGINTHSIGSASSGDDNVSHSSLGTHSYIEDKYCLECNAKSDALVGIANHNVIAATCSDECDASHNMRCVVTCNCDGNSRPIFGLCGDEDHSSTREVRTHGGENILHNHSNFEDHTLNGALHEQGCMLEPIACNDKASKALHGHDSPFVAHEACIKDCVVHPVAYNAKDDGPHSQDSQLGARETCMGNGVYDIMGKSENDDEDEKHIQGDEICVHDVLECKLSEEDKVCVHDVLECRLSGEDACKEDVLVSSNDDNKSHGMEKTLDQKLVVPSINKQKKSSRLEGLAKRGLACIPTKKHGPQHQCNALDSSLLKSSSRPSVPAKGNDSINLWRAYANASFSTCIKLPSSNSSFPKIFPSPAPKKTLLSRSMSLPAERLKASPQRQRPLSSSSGPSIKKSKVQSPPPSSNGSPSMSKCRPPLKPASLNVPVTPNATIAQAQTSAAFARLIALPLVNSKAREDVRLDLRGQKVKSLDCNLVNLTAKMEFVYLRDNKLSHLAGIEILRRVKVLDLSFNDFKGLGMEPLASCKALQQLYLAGNHMTSLSSLPQLPNLEFLSIAQNKLKDLTMATQPKLQVLAASKNKISTFKGFPHFPSLEHLRLEENPLSDMPHVEAVAILLAGPNLKKFNNLDIPMEEQELACMYPPHAGLCIRDGWEFCSVENAYASSFKFLVEKWVDRIPPGHTLEQAFVEQPSEDYPCRCFFTFKKQSNLLEDLDLNFRYQWLIGGKAPSEFIPIEGAIQEVYWPKHEDIGHCLKVECIVVVKDMEYAPTFAVSFPVLPGTGCPKVINLSVSGDFREGNMIYGNADVAWCGGSPSKGIVSWLRHDESSSPRMVPGAEEMEYLLSLDDVGAKLILMYTPLSKECIKGEPSFATTDVIQAGFPTVTNLRVIGDFVEGNTIRGVGKYFGGKEGSSKFEWFKEDPESGGFQLVSSGFDEFILTEKDVGLRIMFQYTPVNSEGFEGIPVSIVTEKVALAPPRVISLQIVGELCEGGMASICATISSGGIEGQSRVRWFKTRVPSKSLGVANMEEIGTSKPSENFYIPLGAVGFYLVAEYTPVLLDGITGEQVTTVSSMPVQMLPPCVTFLSIKGEYREGETLVASYSYVGGKEGNSQFMWYLHENDSDPGSPISEAVGLLEYNVTKSVINKLVSFKCIPVREDGCIGEERSVMGGRPVLPGFPKLLSLDIVGDPMEGSHMQIVKSYSGGVEGPSKIQWLQMNSIGNLKQIEGATSHTYTSTTEDVDSYLCVSYEPCRSDGLTGSVVVSQPFGPVSPAMPTCEELMLCGETVEGEHLTFTAVYKGGVKGSCACQWIRQQADGLEKKLSIRDTLKLTLEDVGCCIRLVYTPVRKDGVSGVSKTVVSDVIRAGEPTAIRLIVPNGCENMEMTPQRSYFGGVEGDSEFTWFRLADNKLEGFLNFSKAQAVGRMERYIPQLEDVGSYLALLWVPVRKDGQQGKPYLACSSQKVAAAPPLVHSVTVKRISSSVFVGGGVYYGGVEGESQTRWYRQGTDGVMTPIPGASSRMYTIKDDDYTYSLVFGYTPIRQDGVVGKLLLSPPTEKIMPEPPRVEKLVMSGKAVEGDVLVVTEEIPSDEKQQHVWRKYIKEVKYQWLRSIYPNNAEFFETLTSQRSCSYTIRTEDIGYFMRCECVVIDVFGRSSLPVSSIISSPISAGIPKINKLEIEGRGYHSDMYAIRGIYSGGKEGKSLIQWFRAMARRLELVPVAGEVGRMYEASVEDVGYRLVAVYTPVREDGVEGTPVSVSTDPIKVEPAIAEEVKEKLASGTLRFEALLNRNPYPTKFHSNQGMGLFEKRIIDINKKRIKAMKPSPKTFLGTELRYSSPFHVEADNSDQHRLKVTIEGESKIELMVQNRHIRDLVVLVIKGFQSQT